MGVRMFCKVLLAAALCFAAFGGSSALSQGFPRGPIRIIVPVPAGGATDVQMRALGQKLAESWGQASIIDNRPGGNMVIAAEAAAKAPADGQTLVFTTDSMISINPYLYSKLSYVPDRDFAPVTLIGFTNTSLMISADLPVSNVREFIDLMQSRPGKFNYGTFGTGTNGHFAAEMFKAATGTDLVHVPFKGGAPMLQALAANEVQAIFIGPGTAIPLIRSGKIKAIGIYSDRRHPLLPLVPTMTEAGYGNIDGANAWWGIMAPAGTPRDVVLKLSDEIIRIFSAADFREKYLIGFALEPALSGPDKFAELLRADREKWARQTRAVNIRLD